VQKAGLIWGQFGKHFSFYIFDTRQYCLTSRFYYMKNKNIKKTIILLAVLWSVTAQAQQELMNNFYRFNALNYNPAYAGSREHVPTTILHAFDWGTETSAPKVLSINGHTPMTNERVGVGINIYNEKNDAAKRLSANLS
jgi:hypothetical protein